MDRWDEVTALLRMRRNVMPDAPNNFEVDPNESMTRPFTNLSGRRYSLGGQAGRPVRTGAYGLFRPTATERPVPPPAC